MPEVRGFGHAATDTFVNNVTDTWRQHRGWCESVIFEHNDPFSVYAPIIVCGIFQIFIKKCAEPRHIRPPLDTNYVWNICKTGT